MLKGNFKKAFNQLKKIGAPVFTPQDNSGYEQYTHDCCQFIMSAEEENSPLFLSTYGNEFGSAWYAGTYSDAVNDILEANGLYGEWANNAVLCICE
jgi:hypothetical protein